MEARRQRECKWDHDVASIPQGTYLLQLDPTPTRRTANIQHEPMDCIQSPNHSEGVTSHPRRQGCRTLDSTNRAGWPWPELAHVTGQQQQLPSSTGLNKVHGEVKALLPA